MRVTLVNPPLTQLNTPYPAIGYLARALRDAGHSVHLRDLGIELVCRVLSREGLREIFDQIEQRAEADELPEPAWRSFALRERHEATIGPVLRFLQGKDRTLATRILHTAFLPTGPRLDAASTEDFGPMGVEDAARYLASLYIEDLCDLVQSCLDEGFSLAAYQHHLCVGPVSFDALHERLKGHTLLDDWLDELADSLLDGPRPDLVGLSVPFPGTLYGALRIGRRLKAAGVPVVMGGGYVNTELRSVSEPRLWENIDALTYDDGEGPLLAILEQLASGADHRFRTRSASGLHTAPTRPATATATATATASSVAWYADLRLDTYINVLDTLNPAHRLWSDGRWNKVTLAHGCYWKRCAFCDINLDYIARYEPARIADLVDQMEQVIEETGCSGFHLVDEAAPPKLLRELALELLRRDLTVSFWGNIRFERTFTPDLCRLLAAAGLIAVTGGLEVASDRLLLLMEKGITVEQAARACRAFREAGVLVHAYLMYGFPTETAEETLSSMEVVRQLFEEGLLNSAFWHRFVLTRHSAVFRDPSRYKVRFTVPEGTFASNDIPHEDPTGADHDRFDEPLVAALEAWKRGQDLEKPVDAWFSGKVPRSREPRDRVRQAVSGKPVPIQPGERLIWLGGAVLESAAGLVLHGIDEEVEIAGSPEEREWLSELLDAASPKAAEHLTFDAALATFPGEWRRFERRWAKVRQAGLIGV